MSSIKRGVSLYSFQEELFLGRMSVADCIAFAASIGATGIEVLPEQNMPSFPAVTDAEVAWWQETIAAHGCELTCYDMFLDTKRRKDRLMRDDEQVDSIRRDLELRHRLGIRNMRILVFVRPDILARCVPYAEEFDVHMGVEVHAPWHLEHAWILRTIDTADRHEQKIMAAYTIYEIAMAETLRHAPYANPKRLKEYAPYFRHIQAKFYERNEDATDPAIAYDEVIPVLAEAGWEGTLSSEYEGNRWIQDVMPVDSREQVRRQHAMFERLIGGRHNVRQISDRGRQRARHRRRVRLRGAARLLPWARAFDDRGPRGDDGRRGGAARGDPLRRRRGADHARRDGNRVRPALELRREGDDQRGRAGAARGRGEHRITRAERLRVSYLPFPSINTDDKTVNIAA